MNTHQGYALIIVLLVTSFLVITVTTNGYKAFLLYDAACVAQRQLQHKQAGKGLLFYAIDQTVRYIQKESDFTHQVLLYEGLWPSSFSKPYTGYAYAYTESDLITVGTYLYYNDQEVMNMLAQINIDTVTKKATLVAWNLYATTS